MMAARINGGSKVVVCAMLKALHNQGSLENDALQSK